MMELTSFLYTRAIPIVELVVLVGWVIRYYASMAPRKGTLEWIEMSEIPPLRRSGFPTSPYRLLVLPVGAVFGLSLALLQWRLEPVYLLCMVGTGVLAAAFGLLLTDHAPTALLTAALGVLQSGGALAGLLLIACMVLLLYSITDTNKLRALFLLLPAAVCAWLGILQSDFAIPSRLAVYAALLDTVSPAVLLPGIMALLCLVETVRRHRASDLSAALLLIPALLFLPFSEEPLCLACFGVFAAPGADACRRDAQTETLLTGVILIVCELLSKGVLL